MRDTNMDSPDKRAFEADIARAAFRLGEAEERWRLIRIEWPIVLVEVSAKNQNKYVLRLDCANYPQEAPTGGPWDLEKNAILEFSQWPRGKRISEVFRMDWENGSALYMPYDRASIKTHSNWRTEMPSKIWHPSEGIVQYLEFIHELLHG